MPKQTLRDTFSQLPRCLQKQVLRRAGAAVLTLVFFTFLILISRDIHYSVGYLISGMFTFFAIDILSKFRAGQILEGKMVICKARKSRKGVMKVIVRDATVQNIAESPVTTYELLLEVPRRDREYITPGTVMHIYVSEAAPSNALAYEILGEMTR